MVLISKISGEQAASFHNLSNDFLTNGRISAYEAPGSHVKHLSVADHGLISLRRQEHLKAKTQWYHESIYGLLPNGRRRTISDDDAKRAARVESLSEQPLQVVILMTALL